MKRVFLAVGLLLLLFVMPAAADYLIIKIDLNTVDLKAVPPMPQGMQGGGIGGPGMGEGGFPGGGPIGPGGGGPIGPGAGMRGGLGGPPGGGPPGGGLGGPIGPGGGARGGPPPGVGPGNPMGGEGTDATQIATESENPIWVMGYFEIKNKPKSYGPAVEFDHQHGKKTIVPLMPNYKYTHIRGESQVSVFNKKRRVDLKDAKDPEKYINLALWAWSHGLMKEFHLVIDDLRKLDPKHPVVKNVAQVQAQLKTTPQGDDPALRPLLDDLRAENYRILGSEKGHYGLLTNMPPTPTNDAQVRRRLARLEDNMESFYYWFALQENMDLPSMPKHRLLGVLVSSPTDFYSKHAVWGGAPMATDGFTPRRDNIMVISARRLDEAYTTLDKNLQGYMQIAKVGREELLTGKVWERKEVMEAAMPVAQVQTLAAIQKSMEEEAERTTLSHEGTLQLLAATGILPRNTGVPQWVQYGLASYFETPHGAVYGAGGLPSWSNLIAFKFHRKKGLGKPRDALYNVLSDRLFHTAERTQIDFEENRDKEKLQQKLRHDWEKARSSAWALVYYLVQNKKFNTIIRYTQELDALPRDLDLDQRMLEGLFAKSFDLGDAKSAHKLDPSRLQGFAEAWFAEMEGVSLAAAEVEHDELKYRYDQANPKKKQPPKGQFPGGGPPGLIPPGGGGGNIP